MSSRAPWETEALGEERLTGSGALLQVRRLGVGEAILLVHGLGVSSTYFGPLAQLLAREMRVVAPDLPGWGGSDRPAVPLDVESAACVLSNFIGAEGIASPTVVANSFGCQVAVELASRRPDLVGALVLISPTVDPRFRSWRRQAQTLVLDWLREPPSLWPIIARDYLKMGPRQFVAISAAALRDRPESKLPRIDVPVLVIRGERDAITTRAWAARCALLARGTFASIPAAAHAPHFSHPNETAQLVSSFVSELADRGD